ncbi:unnamed protein product [Microthlaspi erraticum]|uniref:Reverse transcriptase zinc-binding domain-containing protein n=1 Tax=Microthlaspi erraticum TaxID=1685480 RepID=A0A6D2JVB7_9BRAS|nr:unnamed protein product [Microthlaspi erraticum]
MDIGSPSPPQTPCCSEKVVQLYSYLTLSTKQIWESVRPSAPFQASVWFKDAIPRHAFTMWLAQLDTLPTRDRLSSWGMLVDNTCCLCSSNNDTRGHLFLRCEISQLVCKILLLFHSLFGLVQRTIYARHDYWSSEIADCTTESPHWWSNAFSENILYGIRFFPKK